MAYEERLGVVTGLTQFYNTYRTALHIIGKLVYNITLSHIYAVSTKIPRPVYSINCLYGFAVPRQVR